MSRAKKQETIRDRVFRAILDGRETIVDIAEDTGFQRKKVTYAIKSLRKKNLIRRRPNLSDMRRCRYKPVVDEMRSRGLINKSIIRKLKRMGLM